MKRERCRKFAFIKFPIRLVVLLLMLAAATVVVLLLFSFEGDSMPVSLGKSIAELLTKCLLRGGGIGLAQLVAKHGLYSKPT